MTYQLTDFYYELPDSLIAQQPLPIRSASRLLVLDYAREPSTITLTHQTFCQLIHLVHPNDLLVFNNTRVIPARLFGRKITGGKVECLVERIISDRQALVHVRASKSPAVGCVIYFEENIEACVIEKKEGLSILEFNMEQSLATFLAQHGQIPLPPYIHRHPDQEDLSRYQTLYAAKDGAVAAPTAGLHFDENLLAQLKEKQVEMAYITLHVGAGTFQPVRAATIQEHTMHSEYMEVSESVCEAVHKCRERGGRVIAVGTTSVRCLETASQSGEIKPYVGDTRLFIYPGYQFKSVDALITNFHLPQSTLLMLVAAFAGYENMMQAYRMAVAEKYRFFSYGDAMMIMNKFSGC